MSINTHDTYSKNLVPPINGILWQMLLNNVPLRRPWETLGVGKTLIQWIAVDGYSFIDNPWLPTYNLKLDIKDLCNYPFAHEVIVGTPGYFSEVTSRANIPLMADLAAKFATLDWPENVKGFYLPVEIDPTWHNAKEVLGPVWAQLPRPLYVSAYYGEGIDGEAAAKWLKDLLPPDVNLLFQDGVGAFGFSLELARQRLAQLDKHLGAHRVQMIAEAFEVNPDWQGEDGGYFRALKPDEYRRRMSFYDDLYQQGRLWAFDGPNYIKNDLIDALQGRPSLTVPTNLRATLDYAKTIRLYSDVPDNEMDHTKKYVVYDVSGNTIIRTYYSNPWEDFARYPEKDYLEDFGFIPTFIVFDVQSQRNPRYVSDRSYMYVGDIVEDPSVSNSRVAQSNWGDIVVKMIAEQPYPNLNTYYLDIYHPLNTNDVMRTIELDGSTHKDGELQWDWPVEVNVPDYLAIFGYQGTWGYLKWRIRYKPKSSSLPPDLLGGYESFIVEDNAFFVKKTVICGINSLIGGYFNDLSDPSNHGGTGNLGRKDLTAAHTFRETMAANLGLKGLEVMPVMTVVGSSPINPMPYQSGFDLNNYWWNTVTKQPGPNLIYADNIVKNLKIKPDYFIESGPGETTGISYAPVEQRPAILSAWRQSNIEMLAWMRANWGNPNLEIWFQGASTSWWGDPPPVETNAEGTKLIRKLQESMSLENIGFKMGSYVPDGNLYTTFYNEMAAGMGWVHYTLEGYHACARDMAEAMSKNINRALNPPEWTLLEPPSNIKATKMANKDIRFSWDARPGAPGWYFKNKRADDNAVFQEGAVTTNSFTFTLAKQIETYGYDVSYVTLEVAEYNPTTQLIGAFSLYTGPTTPA